MMNFDFQRFFATLTAVSFILALLVLICMTLKVIGILLSPIKFKFIFAILVIIILMGIISGLIWKYLNKLGELI